jgi:hypothetical protein
MTTPQTIQHGKRSTYVHRGCRCTDCRRAQRTSQAAMRAKRKLLNPEAIPHGTYNGYGNYSCRCQDCKAAGKIANHEKRVRQAEKGPDISKTPHGTTNGYGNYGCRCALCKRAKATYARNLDARRKAEAAAAT